MDEINIVEINGIKYVPLLKAKTQKQIICVDNRGLTFVGDVEHNIDTGITTIHDAQCVIRWGTSQHIAELADKGPLNDTVLGFKKTVYVLTNNIQYMYDCGGTWNE